MPTSQQSSSLWVVHWNTLGYWVWKYLTIFLAKFFRNIYSFNQCTKLNRNKHLKRNRVYIVNKFLIFQQKQILHSCVRIVIFFNLYKFATLLTITKLANKLFAKSLSYIVNMAFGCSRTFFFKPPTPFQI